MHCALCASSVNVGSGQKLTRCQLTAMIAGSSGAKETCEFAFVHDVCLSMADLLNDAVRDKVVRGAVKSQLVAADKRT